MTPPKLDLNKTPKPTAYRYGKFSHPLKLDNCLILNEYKQSWLTKLAANTGLKYLKAEGVFATDEP